MTDTAKSPFIYGCMRLAGDGSAQARRAAFAVLDCAIELGLETFDHADIYGQGRCEEVFGEWLAQRPGLRERITIIGKCGIRHADTPTAGEPKRYDFTTEHIRASVVGSLKRLGVEQLDALLLHRYDHLGDMAELSETFASLVGDGAVARLGVSNFSIHQLDHLRHHWRQPLAAHQLEMNVCDISAAFDGRLEQCLDGGIEAQAWSPLAGIIHNRDRLSPQAQQEIDSELGRQAEKYGIADTSVALGWLMRHPAGIRPVLGTTNPERLTQAVEQCHGLMIERGDWYRLFGAIRQRRLE